MSGTMSDMKKVNAREFQKAFSKVADTLGQGETVAVTKHGKPLGFFTKAPAQQRTEMPDFEANLSHLPCIGPVGEKIIAESLDEPVS
jgi:antitoxin (DNA-binding transcriptional repressor) of toxin-antitoxin stability system